MNIKPYGIVIVLLLIWLAYWECLKAGEPKRPKIPNTMAKRLRRMLIPHIVPTLCARHLPNKTGKMSVVDATNCVKCRSKK